MAMVRGRWNDKAKADFRKSQVYRTRRLLPSDASPDEILCAESDWRTYRALGFVEEVAAEQPEMRGPGRPKKIENQSQSRSQPEASKPKQEQPYLTRQELLSVAEKRGVELPPGYVTRDELAKLVGEVSSDELEPAGG